MLLRHAKLIAAGSALLLSLASTAGAVVLWDQSNWNTATEGSVNLSSNSCSQISGNTKVHTANDVHFDNPVHITTVRIYEFESLLRGYTLRIENGAIPAAESTVSSVLSVPAARWPASRNICVNKAKIFASGLPTPRVPQCTTSSHAAKR